MWKLKNITAKNICAFRDMSYSPKQGCTTLVFGHNMDNNAQGSNGSGKSALIEAIAIGLTGDSLRKVKADEIINDAADEAVITVILSNPELGQMTINRKLSRTQPQAISVMLQTGPYDTDTEEIKLSSVLEYNKYILDMLGLTKDDIFSNFILSKHKYSSFLNASDREKKELINRFSNGQKVDESIEALHADMDEVKNRLHTAERDMAACQGRVEAINEQIVTTKSEHERKESRKAESIAAHEESIANYRSKIRQAKSRITELGSILDGQDKLDQILRDMEEDPKMSVADAYREIAALLPQYGVAPIANYANENDALNKELADCRKKAANTATTLKSYENDVNRAAKTHAELAEKYRKADAAHGPRIKVLEAAITESQQLISELETEGKKTRDQINSLNRDLDNVNQRLAGVIECPKCHHKFLLDSETPVEDLRKEAQAIERKLYRVKRTEDENSKKSQDAYTTVSTNRKELRAMDNESEQLSKEVSNALRCLNNLKGTVSTLNKDLTTENNRVAALEQRINNLRQALFDDAFAKLDAATKKAESEQESLETDIAAWNGSIETYQEAIENLKNTSIDDAIKELESKKEEYTKALNAAISKKESIESELAELTAQEARFSDFKTHLANSKIEALSQITNEFLEAIGSDLRIALSGYTLLRTGKIRDKISISVLRDGIDCGSFAKMSQGEQCRANLASILALHKLTNVNCQDGKGLDLLILDEILDATDEAGLASMFDALNALQITAMVVSHGLIHESYPHRMTVTKQNGVSTLSDDEP